MGKQPVDQVVSFNEEGVAVLRKILEKLSSDATNLRYVSSAPTAATMELDEIVIMDDGSSQYIYMKTAENTVMRIPPTTLAASSVDQTALKTTLGETSPTDQNDPYTWRMATTISTEAYATYISVYSDATSLWYNGTPPGGEYGFYPQVKSSAGDPSAYCQQRYITASGHDHWIFLMVDKVTRKISACYQAPDHPSANLSAVTEKEMSHPFPDYDAVKHEIIVVDNEELLAMRRRVTRHRSLLQVVREDYRIDDTKRPRWKTREIIKIDEYGDIPGEAIKTFKTPEWAKIMICAPEITLKRSMVERLPDNILYKKMALK